MTSAFKKIWVKFQCIHLMHPGWILSIHVKKIPNLQNNISSCTLTSAAWSLHNLVNQPAHLQHLLMHPNIDWSPLFPCLHWWHSVMLKAELSGCNVAGSSGCFLVVFQFIYCKLNVTLWIFQQGSPLDCGAGEVTHLDARANNTVLDCRVVVVVVFSFKESYDLNTAFTPWSSQPESWFQIGYGDVFAHIKSSISLFTVRVCSLQSCPTASVHMRCTDKCGENEGALRAKLNYRAETITLMISIYSAHSNEKRLEGIWGRSLLLSHLR